MLDLTEQDPYVLGQLGWSYGALGHKREARQVLAQLEEISRKTAVPPPAMWYVYLGLQDAEAALDWMEKAYAARWSDVIWIKTGPEYDWLRSNPRFQAFLKKMKLDG
jgi:hypothetical protein